jgi:Pvc16 N-terminal domain
MSGTLAIAAVSAVLKFLLQNSLVAYNVEAIVGATTRVTVLPPDRVVAEEPRLNIYFYRALSNPGWADNRLPSRNERGERVTNPYLALDLHYLITAHGTQDFHGEILLGYAMQIFHENPVLPRQMIRDALTSSTLETPEMTAQRLAVIAAGGLADQIEQIKITPQYPSVEETSNLWSSLQTHYRPSAVYKISVVLIESQRPARAALPVRGYNVYGVPFRHPVITDVIAEDGPGTPILMNKRLVVRGASLRTDDTRVSLAGSERSGADLEVHDTHIIVTLPPEARAGIHGIQVKQYLDMGTPPLPHRGFESNVAVFVLQPLIEKSADQYDIQVLPPGVEQPRRLRIRANPVVEPAQRVEVLLNELNAPTNRLARAYTFEASGRAPGTAPTAILEFPIPGVENGTYLVRVRVDGAESLLDFVPPQGYGAVQGYVAPKVTLT